MLRVQCRRAETPSQDYHGSAIGREHESASVTGARKEHHVHCAIDYRDGYFVVPFLRQRIRNILLIGHLSAQSSAFFKIDLKFAQFLSLSAHWSQNTQQYYLWEKKL